MSSKPVERLDRVIIRFAGDSGDGMQLTGDRFTSETALMGNDLATLPDFPAEIRAPAGSLPGVSAFQIHFASRDILTPGDAPDVLVAMNPAALKANLPLMRRGAMGACDARTQGAPIVVLLGRSRTKQRACPARSDGTRLHPEMGSYAPSAA